MSQNLSDDEDMTSSTPSTPSTPVNQASLSSNPHIPLPPHLDLKTPPQSQDTTPYAPRTTGAAPTLQTSSSTASAFQDYEDGTGDFTSPTGRRRPSGPLGGGNNGVSIMQSSEKGVPAWLTKRGVEEIANAEEKIVDRQFSTHMYADIFNEKDMILQKNAA